MCLFVCLCVRVCVHVCARKNVFFSPARTYTTPDYFTDYIIRKRRVFQIKMRIKRRVAEGGMGVGVPKRNKKENETIFMSSRALSPLLLQTIRLV